MDSLDKKLNNLYEDYNERLKILGNHNISSLNEMAEITDPNNSLLGGQYEIWVYSADRSSMSPHFHILDKNHSELNLEIKISDLTICKSSPRKKIPKNKLKTWEGLSSLKKGLVEWLKKEQNPLLPNSTNYVLIANAWNQNNRSGKQLKLSDLLSKIEIK